MEGARPSFDGFLFVGSRRNLCKPGHCQVENLTGAGVIGAGVIRALGYSTHFACSGVE